MDIKNLIRRHILHFSSIASAPSVYCTASIVETWVTVFPGLLHKLESIISVTSAVPMRIKDYTELVSNYTSYENKSVT